ncbi:MAG: D-aminoacyl-tRNA deacylase [Planctomycetota bacterium]|nr:D-aminoacyl-tRNA deacylase [Planctomycetota bacterium]MCX8039650.1 D-aminoacyl-tRNA deacylase [Planctomycetota bacterium]MDW8373515.1 D-aminoacyl-tRNA deacylase [Planctomycetota bacterium]
MRALVQRVASASVRIADREVARIGRGLLVFLGVARGDSAEDSAWLAHKVHRLRIFPDERGRCALALPDIAGEALVVSQFTLLADASRGHRPDFLAAAAPEIARPLYEDFVARLAALLGRPVPTGVFAAEMQVQLLNDGPFTVILDSPRRPAAQG